MTWTRIKKAAAALLTILTFSVSSSRAQQSYNIDTKWTQKSVSVSTSGITAFTFDVGGFGPAGYAVIGQTQTLNGVDGTTWGNLALVSTATVNVVGFRYKVYSSASSASLKISQTVKTPVKAIYSVQSSSTIPTFSNPAPWANAFSVPLISTSSAITIPSAVLWDDTFQSQVSNPVFNFSGLTTATTLYLEINYGIPRQQ